MQGAQSSPPMKKEATCLRRGFASHDSGTHPKHYHDVQYYHEKGLHYFSSQRNFMRKRSSRCNKRSVSLSVRHMKINQCVTQHFSLEGDIVNILHEGESGAFDRKLSRHNNINKIDIVLFTIDIYNLFFYNYPQRYKLF
jgi:hypothetical protein